jgi:hypothetical protein
VSCFCAEIRLSGKIPENIAKILFYQKTHGARRGNGERLGARLTTRGRGPGLAAPTCGEAASAIASTPPCAYIYPLTQKERGFGVFPRYTSVAPPPSETAIQNQKLRLAPCRDGDLEEIFITIITNVSPSTIHDFPIHV